MMEIEVTKKTEVGGLKVLGLHIQIFSQGSLRSHQTFINLKEKAQIMHLGCGLYQKDDMTLKQQIQI